MPKMPETESLFLTSFQRKLLLENLQADLPPEYRRRIEIMLLADKGRSQTQICSLLGCSQETARYWIAKAQAGQALTWNSYPVGRPKRINNRYLQRLRELVNSSPRQWGYSFEQWTARWLSKHLASEFGIEISDRHISRLLKQMGLSTRKKTNPVKEKIESCEDIDSNLEITNLQTSLTSKVSPKTMDLWLFKPLSP